ncbi:PepSY-associated TM helix domain-containing protein [Steroidobacter flavus]|uniref:PepSY-associated TM helix domain-containing protein n=1 Tax=Steroidobacter flavus TaxID=1842136 RepID=A0ABV8T302_9GAMM
MAWLHTWTGLVPGWVLYFMFLTGTAGYFDTEIDRWMQPERPLHTQWPPLEQTVERALAHLEQVAPKAEQWFISPPQGRENIDLRLFYRLPAVNGERGGSGSETLDPLSGEPGQYRETGGGQLLYQMHYELHYLNSDLANWIVGICSMFMLVAIVTGVIVHKKIFKDFFSFRPGKQQRSWLDAHNGLSVLALPFHVMITFSGLMFFGFMYMPWGVLANYGSGKQAERTFLEEALGRQLNVPLAGVAASLAPLGPMLAQAEGRWGEHQVRSIQILNPGDSSARVVITRPLHSPMRSPERMIFDGVNGRLLEMPPTLASAPQGVHDTLLGLHEGLFAGPGLRWFYFLSGVLGTAMVGTGLVLWTVKRRAQQTKRAAPGFGLALVERLNVGTVVGLPIAVLCYFWANRGLPVTLEHRAAWEAHTMFIVWGLMLLHAQLRPAHRLWFEQFAIAAGLCLLLPLVNALTTDRHLGVTLPQGDWALAGVDLTILAFGAIFALTAFKLRSRARLADNEQRGMDDSSMSDLLTRADR